MRWHSFHKISSLTRVTQTGHPWTVVRVTDQQQMVLLRCPPRFWAFFCTCQNIGKTVFSISKYQSSKINAWGTGIGGKTAEKCVYSKFFQSLLLLIVYNSFLPCYYVVKTWLGYKNLSIQFESEKKTQKNTLKTENEGMKNRLQSFICQLL